jgi:hypothetical protein
MGVVQLQQESQKKDAFLDAIRRKRGGRPSGMATAPDASGPFQHAFLPGRGRALVASRPIRPGEEVLREFPAAMVYSSGDNAEDCHKILAQIVHASNTDQYRHAIAELVCMQDCFEAADAEMLQQLADKGTPAVASLVASWHGQEASSLVNKEAVIEVFCKHALNSMTVVPSEGLSREVGMALYPVHGALMNHADIPNCWTMFEKDDTTHRDSSDGSITSPNYTLVVRCLAPIAEGEEITISYVCFVFVRIFCHSTCPNEHAHYILPASECA